MGNAVKAILFDSGRVLNEPVTGHWFITPNFFGFVDKNKFNSIAKSKREKAFLKAGEYISKQPLINTETAEYLHFLQYYRILFENLPELGIADEQIEGVARDLVYNYEKYSFFSDIYEVVPRLSESYKLAVISDAWPSLENVFKHAGIRRYFSSFVISSVVGTSKPDEKMYITALHELNILPEEAIFVDDSIRNCDGAKKLGIRTYLLCRAFPRYLYNKITCREHKVIKDIRCLYDIK